MPVECVVSRSGGPGVLELRGKARRALLAGELRVRVSFAGVNFADLAARAGFYGPAPKPPFAPGFEVSGTVDELGPGTSAAGLAVGDRVLAATRFGGYADEVVVEARRTRRLPAAMSLEEGAALLAQYLTAYHALTEVARVRSGESVLVHAAAGGVGTAAVQLCRKLGLASYGTASTDEKLTFARAQGLDHGINYVREDFEQAVLRLTGGHGVDVALDANGGASFGKSFRCLAPNGRLVVYGAAAALPRSLKAVGQLPRAALELVRQHWFHPFELIEQNKSVCGLQLLLLWAEFDTLGRELDELLQLFEAGAIHPVVDRVFELSDAASAHRYLHERRTRGKVLLRAPSAA